MKIKMIDKSKEEQEEQEQEINRDESGPRWTIFLFFLCYFFFEKKDKSVGIGGKVDECAQGKVVKSFCFN